MTKYENLQKSTFQGPLLQRRLTDFHKNWYIGRSHHAEQFYPMAEFSYLALFLSYLGKTAF